MENETFALDPYHEWEEIESFEAMKEFALKQINAAAAMARIVCRLDKERSLPWKRFGEGIPERLGEWIFAALADARGTPTEMLHLQVLEENDFCLYNDERWVGQLEPGDYWLYESDLLATVPR